MHHMRRLATVLTAALLGAAVLAGSASAQNFPPSTMKIIVPFPAGGTTDILARHVAQGLTEKLASSVIVENRAGASGTIGSDQVAKSPADGSVVLLTATHHVINPSLYKKLPYDTQGDFAPVALIASAPNALVVHPSVPAKSVAELIALAKKEPGKLSYGSAGVGGANHLAGELFKQMADVDIVHVPYKGAAPAMNDLIGGHIPIMFDSLPTVLPSAADGRLRVLGVTSLKRAPALPDVPTLDEAGVKGFEATAWFGMYMPAAREPGNNGGAQPKIEAAMREILASAPVREAFAKLGLDTGAVTGAEFKSFVDAEITKWGSVVRRANLTIN
jgi:tripartite-type tricarboxylate transporter receptor subunit TctC